MVCFYSALGIQWRSTRFPSSFPELYFDFRQKLFFMMYILCQTVLFLPNTLSTVNSVTKLRMFPRCVIAWLNLNGSFQKGQLAPQPLSMQLAYLCSSNRRRKKQLSICLTNSWCVAPRLFWVYILFNVFSCSTKGSVEIVLPFHQRFSGSIHIKGSFIKDDFFRHFSRKPASLQPPPRPWNSRYWSSK